MTTLSTESTVPHIQPRRMARAAWMAAGGVAIAAAGVGAGLAWRPATTEPVVLQAVDARPSTLTPSENAGDKPAETRTPARKTASATSRGAASPSTAAGHDTVALATQPATVCKQCGVIEGVREVKVKGEGSGVGAVAGGVLGAAVGNQMGKGDGRKAMTVLGAIGGGFAGHEVEKRARSETVYEVRVRMDDGSLRTLTQKTAPAPGSRVTVEGNTLRAAGAPSRDAQMMRTSTGA